MYQQSAEVLLAKALAKIAVDFSLEALSSVVSMPSGTVILNAICCRDSVKKRSLLTSVENHVTLLLEAGKLYTPS